MYELNLVETTTVSQMEADVKAASVQQFAEYYLLLCYRTFPCSV